MQVYPTTKYLTFQDALQALSEEEVFEKNIPQAAAFACAGPVKGNKCEMTNLSWTIDGNKLSDKHGIRHVPGSITLYSFLLLLYV